MSHCLKTEPCAADVYCNCTCVDCMQMVCIRPGCTTCGKPHNLPVPQIVPSDKPVHVHDLWTRVRPDAPYPCATFYQVDKGWWRLLAKPSEFYDFYAQGKNVGEGPKSLRDPGIGSSKARVVLGLEKAEDWSTAFYLCWGTVVGAQ